MEKVRNLQSLVLTPLDIMLTRSSGLYGSLIRIATRSRGEQPSRANHVAACITAGSHGIAPKASIIEALWTIETHPSPYSEAEIVAIYQPLDLSINQMVTIHAELMAHAGESYGGLMIPLHFVDWVLFNGRVVARRLSKGLHHQICSTLIAHAWSGADLHFGVEPYAAQPDDIHDYCATHPKRYKQIWPVTTQND